MNLLVFSRRLQVGGAEKVLATLTTIWSSLGHRVYLVTHKSGSGFEFKATYTKRYSVIRWTDVDVEELHKTFNFGCVIFNDSWNDSQFEKSAQSAKTAGVPVVLINHHAWNNWCFSLSNAKDTIKSIACSPVDCLVCVSPIQALWWRLKGFYTILIQNPVELPEKLPQRCDDGRTLIWVGRPKDSTKRIGLLVELFDKIFAINNKARLLILGEIDDYTVQALLASVRLEARSAIEFTGRVPNVYDYLSKSSVFMFTSLWEVSPQVFDEARTCGVPIVTYDFPIYNSGIENDGIIRVATDEAFVSAVVELLRMPERRAKIGHEGTIFAYKKNDRTHAVAEWAKLFASLNSQQSFMNFISQAETNYCSELVYKNTIKEVQRGLEFFGGRWLPILSAKSGKRTFQSIVASIVHKLKKLRRVAI